MDLLRIDHEIVIDDENTANPKPRIALSFVSRQGDRETVFFTYAQLMYFIQQLECS